GAGKYLKKKDNTTTRGTWVAQLVGLLTPDFGLSHDLTFVGSSHIGLWADRRPSPFPAAAIQATRALMVVSLVLGFLAMFVATMGMKCTSCGGDDKVKKARIAMTGGGIFLVAGLAALVACSWYGHQIVTDFYNPLVPMNLKYEFGPAIFIGWAGSALVILGGALLSCSCPGSESKAGYRAPRSYPKPNSAKEYV
uniref:Claudin 7 n=1 Tax=Panthera tigris altaica TaxID=74533 RepID=A0A8C9K3B6_PANTA